MEGKRDKVSEIDLGALERDLLEYDLSEAEDGGANETLMMMTPSHLCRPPPKNPQHACLPWSQCP